MSIFFFIAILIFSLVQNSQTLVVFALYLCIFLEGVSISALVIYSRSEPADDFPSNFTDPRSEFPTVTDVVTSMNIYVTYAEKGSEHSRRELAYIIRNLLEDRQSRKADGFVSDAAFQSDLKRVMLRYTVEDEADRGGKKRKKESRHEREAYLTSLERVVKKLGSGE